MIGALALGALAVLSDDVQRPDVPREGNLRGLFTCDPEGRFWFRTIVPKYYPIPDDGPVGDLLRTTGRHPYRPAHIHVIVSAPGYQSVTTHIFVEGDPYLDSDAVFAVKNSLVTARELGLGEQEQQFQKLAAVPDPGILSLKDCFLFPNCEGDIPGNVDRMYQLRSKCPDWPASRAAAAAGAG